GWGRPARRGAFWLQSAGACNRHGGRRPDPERPRRLSETIGPAASTWRAPSRRPHVARLREQQVGHHWMATADDVWPADAAHHPGHRTSHARISASWSSSRTNALDRPAGRAFLSVVRERRASARLAPLLPQEVHHDVLAERERGREVRLAARDLRHLLY